MSRGSYNAALSQGDTPMCGDPVGQLCRLAPPSQAFDRPKPTRDTYMTTLQSWISYSDTGQRRHLPRAVYLASDSRITWGTTDRRWEAGRKVFAANVEPHLFGYSGDVVLPSLVIGQIVSAIDARVLFGPAASAEERHAAVLRAVERGVAAAVLTPTLDFVIHHLHRERAWPQTRFRAWTIAYSSSQRTCKSWEVGMPRTTTVIGSFGTGQKAVQAHYEYWQETEAKGRSRAIHASFCDSVRSPDDPFSGGPPQLAALYVKGPAVQIGVFVEGRAFLNGLEVDLGSNLEGTEWRDCLGQVVDPKTYTVAQGARRFARPSKLIKS